jgi:predicted AAA+ superfamily ATPase
MKQLFERRAVALLRQALNSMPVVALVGPRQVGKTTLAMQLSKHTTKKRPTSISNPIKTSTNSVTLNCSFSASKMNF